MYIHELKCRRCGEVAEVRGLTPLSESVDKAEDGSPKHVRLEIECQIECPNCGLVTQAESLEKNFPATH